MKKLFGFAILSIIGGLVCFTIGMSMLDWDFVALDTEVLTKEEYIFNDDINNLTDIEVSLGIGRLKIVRGDILKIIYYDGDRTETNIAVSNGRLNFSQSYKEYKGLVVFNGIKRAMYFTEIHIPQNLIINLNAETRNSAIEAKEAGRFSQLRLTTTNSSILLTNVSTEGSTILKSTNDKITLEEAIGNTIKLDTTNGSVGIKNIECKEFNAETSNGKITVKNINVEGDTILATRNGDIYVSEVRTDTLKAETTNDKIELKNIVARFVEARSTNDNIEASDVRATSRIKLSTSNDSIYINKIESPDIYLYTSNAKITGTIIGNKSDYSIESSTTNGSNNLGNNSSNGDNKLYVRTTNDKISISFVNS